MNLKFTTGRHAGKTSNLTREQMERRLHEHFIDNPKFYAAIRKIFDRSFIIGIDDEDGVLRMMVKEKDTGAAVMTVQDVAIFLQIERAAVRRLTRERAQRKAKFPIPFVKIGGKMIRFSRPAIVAWWAKQCENGNPTLALPPKGKQKRK